MMRAWVNAGMGLLVVLRRTRPAQQAIVCMLRFGTQKPGRPHLPESRPRINEGVHMKNNIVLSIILLSLVAPALAAAPYQRPAGIADDKEPLIVAGYRALFTCSAHFFAGRPLDDIKKVELVDVEGLGYPDPVIDERRRIVTAATTSICLRMAWTRATACSAPCSSARSTARATATPPAS